MKKLRDIISKNVGWDMVTEEYLTALKYDLDTLNAEAVFYGTVADGINRAKCWSVNCGGWHISTQTAEFYTEEDPAEDDSFKVA